MSVQEGNQNDFRLVQSQGGQIMTINRRGYALVFFKMSGCQGCDAFAPVFSELSRTPTGVDHFVSVNVTNYRNIIGMSRNTKTPIQTVPLIILYVDGNPYAKYTGKKTLPDMLSFITKNTESNSASFIQPPQHAYPSQQASQQRGMYGHSQYSHPPLQPDAHNRPPNRPPQPYAQLGEPDDDDDEKLLIPGQVTPHNVPWEGNYRRMGGTAD